jgi:NADH:ubiquinone oxidoreductase subunit B-like Fe-S oxidoreductase
MRLLLLAASVLAASALLVAPSTGAAVGCGRISITPFGSTRQLAYSVKIVAGNVSCRTARRVMRTFLAKSASPRGWVCARGHASQAQKWAAACATTAGADVKAYGPLRR